jgi:hypothetical protein
VVSGGVGSVSGGTGTVSGGSVGAFGVVSSSSSAVTTAGIHCWRAAVTQRAEASAAPACLAAPGPRGSAR